MLPDKLHLEIVTPERRVLERDVDEVILPGIEGSFGVLPGHAPMLSGLQAGVAVCRGGGQDEVMAISSGYAEVQPSRVIVIAETLHDAEDTYPIQWIEEAVRIAVENNVRRWKYVDAILKRWQEGGRDE